MGKAARKLLDLLGAFFLLGPWGKKKAALAFPETELNDLRLSSVKQVVIFAPHPDDEVFGAGLLLNALMEKKIKMTIVYVTSGQKYSTRARADRTQEAKALAKNFQAQGVFLNFDDGELVNNEERLLKEASACLKGADLAVAPAYNDYHIDHRVLAKAVLKAAKAFPQLKLLMYCTCAPLWPDFPLHYLLGDFRDLIALFQHYPASAAPSVIAAFRVLRTMQARRYLGEKVFWEPYWQLAGADIAEALEKAGQDQQSGYPFLTATRHWRSFVKSLGERSTRGKERIQ